MRCDDDALQSIILRILIQIGRQAARQAGQRANEFNSNYVTDIAQFLLLLVVNIRTWFIRGASAVGKQIDAAIDRL